MRTSLALTGWDIDILTPDEYNQGIERLTNCVKGVEGADDTVVDKLIALGVISALDLEDVGAEPLIKELNIEAGLAEKLIAVASEEAKRLAAEPKKQAEDMLEQQVESGDSE
jgi:N utilization substance protein A